MGSMKTCIAVAKRPSFPPDGIILCPRMSSIATSATSPDRAVAFELQRGDSRPHSPDHGCVRGHARRLTSAFEGFIAVPTEPFRRLWLRRSLVSWCPLGPYQGSTRYLPFRPKERLLHCKLCLGTTPPSEAVASP